MAVVRGFKLKADICKALGLDGKQVRRVVLEIDVEKAVTAYVQFYPDQDQLQAVADALENRGADDPVVVEPVVKVDVDSEGRVVWEKQNAALATAAWQGHALGCEVCRRFAGVAQSGKPWYPRYVRQEACPEGCRLYDAMRQARGKADETPPHRWPEHRDECPQCKAALAMRHQGFGAARVRAMLCSGGRALADDYVKKFGPPDEAP